VSQPVDFDGLDKIKIGISLADRRYPLLPKGAILKEDEQNG